MTLGKDSLFFQIVNIGPRFYKILVPIFRVDISIFLNGRAFFFTAFSHSENKGGPVGKPGFSNHF